jgi:hypothetical protein
MSQISTASGCKCPIPNPELWMILKPQDDPQKLSVCRQCQKFWHYCIWHQTMVEGLPRTENSCTCSKYTGHLSHGCCHCGSPRYRLAPSVVSGPPSQTTRQCLQCLKVYHVCPLHGKAVPGPGYPSNSIDQTRCQCHQQLSFLNASWSSPFTDQVK